MKISKIYANKEEFKTITFDKGINFILSSNNGVGKTSLFKLIDFCLLGDKSFLSNEHFKDYIFYIELQIASNRYITIKRPIAGGKNIELKITKQKSLLLLEKEFNKKGSLSIAKSFFENKVNYSINKFRTYITYFLRDETNQNDTFILNKFKNAHEVEYKTLVSNLLGIDGRKIKRKYDLEKSDDNAQELEKVIEENKTLDSSLFIEKLKISIGKYGKMILNIDVDFLVNFNSSNDIEFTLKVEKENMQDSYVNKLLCFIWSSALAENYVQKRLIKFVAFDAPFNKEQNNYEEGIYNAIHELHRKGIQTIITSNKDDITNTETLEEIENDYLTGYLSENDKLMGEF